MNTHALPSPGWTKGQRIYIGWLATPSGLRSPATEFALSQTLGVKLTTLKDWRELPGFMPAVRGAARETLGQRYADVLHKLEDQAADGSLQHQKIYLQLFEEEPIDDPAPLPNVIVPVGVDLSRVGRADPPIRRSQF